METVENSAKNNCAEFSTVPTAPTTLSLRRGKQNIPGKVVQNWMDKMESGA